VAFGSYASRGELALVTAKGGADEGATSAFVLPMVGTMTIITSFCLHILSSLDGKLVTNLDKNLASRRGQMSRWNLERKMNR
jgi:K+:H+ antiporter